jgi:hypothetical protein
MGGLAESHLSGLLMGYCLVVRLPLFVVFARITAVTDHLIERLRKRIAELEAKTPSFGVGSGNWSTNSRRAAFARIEAMKQDHPAD